MSGRWVAIANPGAGKTGAAERVGDRLLREGLVDDVIISLHPGDGVRHAKASHAYDGIVAVGGDGTVAALLAGMDIGRQRLAVMPIGHGNCLARDAGFADLHSALRALRRGVTRAVDLVRVHLVRHDGRETELLAASTLAVGYVAEVVRFGRRRLAPLGKHAYTVASVLTRPRKRSIRLHADLAIQSHDATGIVVNNTAHLSYFKPFRAARMDDGRLDVMVLDSRWPGQLLHNASVLARSAVVGPKLMLQAGCVALSLDRPHEVMVDGEMFADVVRMEMTCLPSSLQCLVAS